MILPWLATGRPPRPRSIRRYGNRKLYDAAARRYVTLEDVARLVADGHEVEVVDQKTGEDLTSLTLAQVILEGVKQGASRHPEAGPRSGSSGSRPVPPPPGATGPSPGTPRDGRASRRNGSSRAWSGAGSA